MKERLMEFVSELMERQQRVESGETESESITVGGSEIRAERLDEASVRYSLPDEVGMDATVWLPSETRPAGYPTEIPFLPNLRTSITDFRAKGRQMVSWPKTQNQDGFVREVAEELESLGWVQKDERSLLLGLIGRELEFERGDSRCKLGVNQLLQGRGASVRLTVDFPTEGVRDTA